MADITFLIVTFKSSSVIHKCLQSIPKGYPILVVENSSDENFKKELENSYENLECILNYENLGYAKANNIGLKKAKTKYVFVLNPDTILKENTVQKILSSSLAIKDFALLAPMIENEIAPNFGFFNKNKTNSLKDLMQMSTFFKVDFIKGFAMFFNKDQFKDVGFFDENFFMYLEEIDLCKRLEKKNIYVISEAKINHLGAKAVDPNLNYEVEISRNWHWMWSSFYYEKKHNGIFFAYVKTIGNFLSSFIKYTFLLFINKKKSNYYRARFFGLLNAYLGKPSNYRLKV